MPRFEPEDIVAVFLTLAGELFVRGTEGLQHMGCHGKGCFCLPGKDHVVIVSHQLTSGADVGSVGHHADFRVQFPSRGSNIRGRSAGRGNDDGNGLFHSGCFEDGAQTGIPQNGGNLFS